MTKSRKKKLILSLLLVILALFLFYFYYLFVLRGQKEPPTTAEKTSTHAAVYTLNEMIDHLSVYDDYFSAAQKKNLADQPEFGTYIIAGLNATKTVDKSKAAMAVCTSMTPQGLAVTEDYVVVSAYCHTHTHNSVLYMIDKDTHHFIKEIILPDKSHVGGLAYDPIYRILWISGRSKNTAYANAYSLEQMEAYNADTEQKPLSYTKQEPLYGLIRNSFMTYSEGYLYAGYFSLDGNSVIHKYHVDTNGGLEKVYSSKLAQDMNIADKIPIPEGIADISAKAQGVTFYNDYMLLAQSYGPLKSTLRIFRNPPENLVQYDFKDNNAVASYEMPRQMEQIYAADGKVYILFESAAYAYRAYPSASMDRVLTLDITDEHGEVIENEPSPKLFTSLRTRDVYGRMITKKVFEKEKVTMIYLWSADNEHCVEALADMEQLYDDYKDKSVNIMGLVIDTSTEQRQAGLSADVEEKVLELLSENDVTFPQLTLPANLVDTEIGKARHFPTTYFVDENGNILGSEIYGTPSITTLENQLDKRLEAIEKAEAAEKEKAEKEKTK